MKKQNEMLELFQVEELEKRYEMGWCRRSGSMGPVDSFEGPTIVWKF